MFLILHKSRVCFVSSQVIDQWSYFNQNKSIVSSIMIRYSRQFISTISIISHSFPSMCAMAQCFFAGFLICFDQPGSLLLSLSPRASGTCSPCVAKGHGMAMCDEVASLVISEFWTKTWVRTAVCSKRLIYTIIVLLTLKDIKGLVPFPWHIKELWAAGISAVEPFCLDVCFGWEMTTWQ